MSLPLEELVAQLRSSGLIDSEVLAAALAGLATVDAGASEQLVQRLHRGRHLTRFQARQILAGRAASLTLGNYLLLEKLGEGGMGAVYKALHRRMQRTVAVKVLPVRFTQDEQAVQRFHREVQAAARLSHPNIVAAFDADEARGTHFLVMEYVDGADLSLLVKRSGAMQVDVAIDCILQAARGLAYAHAHGVVHRDIKPANLLLDGRGVVKILDMGLARIEEAGTGDSRSELTNTGIVMGTVDYMSPEQALNTKNADHRSDQYSLGVSLYYLLVGRTPYRGESLMEKLLAHREAAIPSLCDARNDVPVALDGVFRRMLSKRPAERFASMTECLSALEAVQRDPAAARVTIPQDDGSLQKFLGALSSETREAVIETGSDTGWPPAGERSDGTIRSGSGSDTRPTTADSSGFGLLMTPQPGGRSSSRISGVRRRPRGTSPTVWLVGLTIAFLGVVAAAVWIAGDHPSDSRGLVPSRPEARASNAAEPSRPTSPRRAEVTVSERDAVVWALGESGKLFVGQLGSMRPVLTVEEWEQAGQPITGLQLYRQYRISDADLYRLRGFPELLQLNLNGCQITDAGLDTIGSLRQLRELDLSNNKITDAGLRSLDLLVLLTRLNLAYTGVTGRGLVHLTRLSQLYVLDLTGCDLNDADVASLVSLRGLRELKLGGASRLTDACLSSIRALSLNRLQLERTGITDAGLSLISEMKQLQHLVVAETKCTPGGLILTATQLPLWSLACQGIAFSSDEAEALRNALPYASIAATVPIPPSYGEPLSRLTLEEHALEEGWRKPGLLLTPAPVPGRTQRLKLPWPRLEPAYHVRMKAQRTTTAAGPLGIILPVEGRQALLLMDDDAGWGLEGLRGLSAREAGMLQVDELARIPVGRSCDIQIRVQPFPDGWSSVIVYFNGREMFHREFDALDLVLPRDVEIPGWGGLALISRGEFAIESLTIQPLPRVSALRIDSPIVSTEWPDTAPSATAPVELLTGSQWSWTPAENLGPRINNDLGQYGPRLTADGLTLLLQEKSQPWRLLLHRRAAREIEWRPPVPVPIPPDAAAGFPWLSPDGCHIVATIAMPGEPRLLWQSTREDSQSDWRPWQPVLTETGTQAWEDISPVLAPDLRTLYFGSSRPGGLGGFDIWIARRDSAAEPWGQPVHAGPVINSDKSDIPTEISADGEILIIGSSRLGTLGNHDLWTVRLNATSDTDLAPVNLGNSVNTQFEEKSACLASDGRTLLFDSEGRFGFGSGDLWISRRAPAE